MILCGLAHAAVVGHSPGLATNTSGGIEKTLGIVLALDLEELVVVDTEEVLLPVALLVVGLVHVSTSTGSGSLDDGLDLIGDSLLGSEHLVEGSLEAPGQSKGDLDNGLAPEGHDRVDTASTEVGDVQTDTNEDDTLVGESVSSRGEAGELVTGDEATTEERGADLDVASRERTPVVVVVLIVAGELGILGLEGDAESGKSVGEGLEDSPGLLLGLVIGSHGGDRKESVGEEVDDHDARVNDVGEGIVEGVDHGVDGLGLVLRGGDHELGTADLGLRVKLDSHGGDDTVVTATTASESPVEVGILGSRSSDELAGRGDDLILENVVGSETIDGAESRVATTLSVTTGETDRGALSSDNDRVHSMGSGESLEALDTGADLEGLALVVAVLPLLDLGALQVVSPDGQGASTG